MSLFSKAKTADSAESTTFSEFIRTASSAKKKKVYGRVLKKATERQNRLISSKATKAK